MTPAVILIPTFNNPDLSQFAVHSALNQDVADLQVLVIDQGSDRPTVDVLEAIHHPRLRLWRHHPPLPSLAATWNRGLQYAWAVGAPDCLVVNNDVQLPRGYYRQLRARLQQDSLLFLSGVGVNPGQIVGLPDGQELTEPFQLHPDFSAFLITRGCHWAFPFDEAFVPAYCEDVDYHRRLLLADEGRRIGKINIPFLHYASGALKAMDPEKNAAWSKMIDQGSRAHYTRKWGPVNAETKVEPFGPDLDLPVTMHALRTIADSGFSVREYLANRGIVHRIPASEIPDGPIRVTQSETEPGSAPPLV